MILSNNFNNGKSPHVTNTTWQHVQQRENYYAMVSYINTAVYVRGLEDVLVVAYEVGRVGLLVVVGHEDLRATCKACNRVIAVGGELD